MEPSSPDVELPRVGQEAVEAPGREEPRRFVSLIDQLAILILPLPDAKLWRWMLPAPAPKTTEGEDR